LRRLLRRLRPQFIPSLFDVIGACLPMPQLGLRLGPEGRDLELS